MKKIVSFIIILGVMIGFGFYSYKKQNQSNTETVTKTNLQQDNTKKYFYKDLPDGLGYQEYTPWELEEIYINGDLEKIKKSYRGYLITEEKNGNVGIIQVHNNKDISELSDNGETRKYSYQKILSFSGNLVEYDTLNEDTQSGIEDITGVIEKDKSYSLFYNSKIIAKNYDEIEILALKNNDVYYGAKKDDIQYFYKNHDLLGTDKLLTKYKDFHIEEYKSFAGNKGLYLTVSFTTNNGEMKSILLENFKPVSGEYGFIDPVPDNTLEEGFFYLSYETGKDTKIHLPNKIIQMKNDYWYRPDAGYKISKNGENLLIYMGTKNEFFPFYNGVQITQQEADKISAQMQ